MLKEWIRSEQPIFRTVWKDGKIIMVVASTRGLVPPWCFQVGLPVVILAEL